MATYLGGVRTLILEQGMGKGRARILRKQLEANGSSVVSSLEPSVTTCTHLLVGKNVRCSRLPVLLGVEEVPGDVRVVRADWLSSCLIRGEYVSEAEYDVPLETTPLTTCTFYWKCIPCVLVGPADESFHFKKLMDENPS